MTRDATSDEEANRKVSLTVTIANYAYKRLEQVAARIGVTVEMAAVGELHRAVKDERGWYTASQVEWEAGYWISRNLFPPPSYAFSAEPFEAGGTLHLTPVDDPLLKGIVDGVGRPAPWTYARLLNAVRDATGGANADAFYVALHDNMVAETRWVRRHDWGGWWHPLYALQLLGDLVPRHYRYLAWPSRPARRAADRVRRLHPNPAPPPARDRDARQSG